jgi:Cu-processing system ATP-binding protein
MIQLKQIHKAFKKQEVLKGIDTKVNSKGITVVLGPNGSGKTTMLKSILGLVIPDSGDIIIDGKVVNGQWEYRRKIGYMSQIARFPENLKVKELIKMVKTIRQQESREDELIRRFDLEPYLDKTFGNLSGGTKQKVNIVLSFMFDTPILMLDEPTTGLDPVALIRLKELIMEERQAGKCIIMTTHIMSLVEEMADELFFILEGKIWFRGTVEQLVKHSGESNLERAIAAILSSNNSDLKLKKQES